MRVINAFLWPIKWAIGLNCLYLTLPRKATQQELAFLERSLSNSAYDATVYCFGSVLTIKWAMRSVSLILVSTFFVFFVLVGVSIFFYGLSTLTFFYVMLGFLMAFAFFIGSRIMIASYRESPKMALSDLLSEQQ